MQTSSRLYQCLLCHTQVIICHRCDRGNRYCPAGCSEIARKTSLSRATRKYQQSRAGRFNNAARQKHFRNQEKQKVTHQGSQPIRLNDVLKSHPKTPRRANYSIKQAHLMYCHHCGEACCHFLRHDFLRGKTHKAQLRY